LISPTGMGIRTPRPSSNGSPIDRMSLIAGLTLLFWWMRDLE